MDAGNRRAILAALLANSGMAVAKFVGYAVTGSSAMLAECAHSVADTGNQALLLFGAAAAKRSPSSEHPFGYGRERYFWAFVVALVLFSLGGLFAVHEGLEKLSHPEPLTRPEWAIGILLLSVVLESFSLRTAILESRVHKRESSWWDFIRHTKNPELPVVLLEDTGALCGLVLALLGVGLSGLTGDGRFDAYASIAIGLFLGLIAAVLAFEMRSLLLGEAASAADLTQINEAILTGGEVRRVIHMRTQHLGPDDLLVAAKVELDSTRSCLRGGGL